MEEQEIRIRKQVTIEYRGNKEPYFISIRALTFNPNITERGLMMEIVKEERLLSQEIGYNHLERLYKGVENVAVSKKESNGYNNTNVYIQINIRKQQFIKVK